MKQRQNYGEIKPVHDIPTFQLMIIYMLTLARKRKAHKQNYKNIILNYCKQYKSTIKLMYSSSMAPLRIRELSKEL